MDWSLDYQGVKEPELLDEFFLAVGKALYWASAFERKCQWVLRMVKLTDYLEEGGDTSRSAVNALLAATKERLLGPTVTDMKKLLEDFSFDDVVLLERAKVARNFIAHHIADIIGTRASAKEIVEQRERLRSEVDALVAGDNVVSCWIDDFQNKEPVSRGMREDYPTLVRRWIFGAID
jgi:hypothetical protein